MRKALAEAGYDDIPGNGMYVIGGLALDREDIPLGQLIRELGLSLSKQGAAGRNAGDARLLGARHRRAYSLASLRLLRHRKH
jgi:hypothetical protein